MPAAQTPSAARAHAAAKAAAHAAARTAETASEAAAGRLALLQGLQPGIRLGLGRETLRCPGGQRLRLHLPYRRLKLLQGPGLGGDGSIALAGPALRLDLLQRFSGDAGGGLGGGGIEGIRQGRGGEGEDGDAGIIANDDINYAQVLGEDVDIMSFDKAYDLI